MKMSLVDRVKNILLTPKTEWPVIAGESTNTASLFTGYALILAVIPLVASIIGTGLLGAAFGGGLGAGFGIGTALVGGVLAYLFGMGILFLMSIIAASLAPSFGGQNDKLQALKLLTYSYTPMWVAGIVGIVSAIPIVGWLIAFIVGLAALAYAVYLLFLGAPELLKVPADKNVGFVAVTCLIWLAIAFVASLIIGAIAVVGAVSSAGGLAAISAG
jgi:hypothetical protein